MRKLILHLFCAAILLDYALLGGAVFAGIDALLSRDWPSTYSILAGCAVGAGTACGIIISLWRSDPFQ